MKQKHRQQIISVVYVLFIITIVFFLWQIDVTVGAVSTGGYVFQDGHYIDPLVYYESVLTKLWLAFIGFILFTGYFLQDKD